MSYSSVVLARGLYQLLTRERQRESLKYTLNYGKSKLCLDVANKRERKYTAAHIVAKSYAL